MSILLFSIGGFAFVAGLIVAGFGLPDSEFSFGNTLIIAGTTSAIGGLIVIGLGAVVSHLRQVIDALRAQVPIRSNRAGESHQSAGRATSAQGRIPFPPTAKSEPSSSGLHIPEQRPAAPAAFAASQTDRETARSFTPTLPNPEGVQFAGVEEASSTQQYPNRSALRSTPAPAQQTHTSFDANLATETKPEKLTSEAETEFSPSLDEAYESDTIAPQWVDKPQDIPILKSGVVDGMGYTLYVDGSIEAELPEGTLRFASIDELRGHLENVS